MKSKTFIIIALFMLSGASVYGQNGKSLGLGGAYTSLARGVDAVHWNPANLAFRSKSIPSISAYIYSFRIGFGNNSFSKSFYDKYIGFEGDSLFIDNSDKNEILGLIPENGVTMDMRGNISLFNLRVLNFGLNVETNFYTKGTLPKALFDIALNGLTKSNYKFKPDAEVIAYSKIKFCYGYVIKRDKTWMIPGGKKLEFKDISVGGAVSYILGLAYAKVESADITFINGPNGLNATGNITTKEAISQKLRDENGFGFAGSGIGLDLAFSALTYDNITISAVAENIIGNINWNDGTKERTATLDLGGPYYIIGEGELQDVDTDSITHDKETDIGSFKTSLPRNFRLGVSKEWNRFLAAVEIGTDRGEFFGAIGLGAHLSFMNGFIGYRNYESFSYFSAGLAFDLKYFYLDLGIRNRGGIGPSSSKGLIFASCLRIGL
ncbi:hypothetical protein DRQ09_07455 [candidate division KSB1 bacterium]|nr:MAG: hypothetical protein DRQ09_07455 [candidate division KSB1 bacterium]